MSVMIDNKEIFVQLFRIYEKEFLEILEYVAPIKSNYETSSNKIHEIHLRVCAELENLIKEISKQIKPELNFSSDFTNKQQRNGNSKLSEILEKLSDKEVQTLNNYIQWRHPDFAYFLWILDNEISLCSKKIKFLSDLEQIPTNNSSIFFRGFYIQPFNKEEWLVPKRWTNYNKIKHDKIKNYDQCTLIDLINSFWAYFMLLHYLIFWYDKKIKLNKPPYNHITKDNIAYEFTKYDISSAIYEISSCITSSTTLWFNDWHLNYNTLNQDQYDKIKDTINNGNSKMELYTNSDLLLEECIYCSYRDYEPIIVWYRWDDIWDNNIYEYRKINLIKFVNNPFKNII